MFLCIELESMKGNLFHFRFSYKLNYEECRLHYRKHLIKISYFPVLLSVSLKDLQDSDNKWYGALHGTRWLQHVMSCINGAVHVVNQMSVKNKTVVLKGKEYKFFKFSEL